MALDFPQLCETYGSPDRIPDEVLYEYLDTNRVDLANEAKLGVDRIPNSKLGREVRRRTKSDLFWVVRYFCWQTNPACGGRPVSENWIDREHYGPVCDLFVKKDDSKPILQQSDVKTRMLLWPRGGMKALDIETLIPTPSGFRKMQDIQADDSVFDETGQPVRVVGVSPIYENRPCYRVTFSSGEKIVADEGHLWLTDARRDRENKPRKLIRGTPTPAVKTTKQIADTLFCRKERNHRVQVTKAIACAPPSLPISPYVLGVWLGDGTSASAQLTCDVKDKQIVEELAKEGQPAVLLSEKNHRWGLNGGPDSPDFRKQNTGLAPKLRKLGVLNNKHIPEEYLWASEDQRLALLQGLMDTDGTISKDGKCRFDNTNRVLAEQTKQLIASLGMKPSLGAHQARINGRDVGETYSVYFYSYRDRPVFRLQRKKDRLRDRRKVSLQNYRTIVSVEPVETRPVKCICVDSPSHLYLAGEGFIPTHNSTIDGYDTVQWILNFPDIRILMLTAEDSLAVGFVEEVKGHFLIHEGEPTLMNLFFPEFCIEEKDMGAAQEFTSPVFARKQIKRKEPTLLASSVGATKSGKHFEVIKADDAVSDKNSESSDQCTSISNKLYLAEKLLVAGGHFIDYIGTRYADEDHYGVLLEKNVGDLVITTGKGWTLTENKSSGVKILIGRAIQIKPEVAQALAKADKPVTYQEAGEDGCELLLPHIMPFRWLVGEFTKNEKSFEGQLNQNPRPASQVTFDRVLMLKATVPYHQMPVSGPVSQVWDFAYSSQKKRDYSTGCSIMWREEEELDEKGNKTGRMATVGYVQKIVRGRFNHATLAKAVVDLAVEFKPFVIGVEKSAGADFLTLPIQIEAARTNDPQVNAVCSNIDWFPVDNQKDAKKVRMAALYPWILDGRLKFASHCMGQVGMDILYSEFEKCLTSHHHDDIPDVVSHQPRYAPRATQQLMENPQSAASDKAQLAWNIMFENADCYGRIGYGPPVPLMQEPELYQDDGIRAESPDGLPNILGAGIWG